MKSKTHLSASFSSRFEKLHDMGCYLDSAEGMVCLSIVKITTIWTPSIFLSMAWLLRDVQLWNGTHVGRQKIHELEIFIYPASDCLLLFSPVKRPMNILYFVTLMSSGMSGLDALRSSRILSKNRQAITEDVGSIASVCPDLAKKTSCGWYGAVLQHLMQTPSRYFGICIATKYRHSFRIRSNKNLTNKPCRALTTSYQNDVTRSPAVIDNRSSEVGIANSLSPWPPCTITVSNTYRLILPETTQSNYKSLWAHCLTLRSCSNHKILSKHLHWLFVGSATTRYRNLRYHNSSDSHGRFMKTTPILRLSPITPYPPTNYTDDPIYPILCRSLRSSSHLIILACSRVPVTWDLEYTPPHYPWQCQSSWTLSRNTMSAILASSTQERHVHMDIYREISKVDIQTDLASCCFESML